MRILAFTALLLTSMTINPIFAQTSGDYRIVKTSLPFASLEEKAKEAITKNKMNIVNRASASDGAKARGVTIKGDVVLGVYRNDLAVRMLSSNIDAGIEAPIRLHLVEEADGTSTIRYYTPGAVFSKYPGEDLKKIASELDVIFEAIVKDIVGN